MKKQKELTELNLKIQIKVDWGKRRYWIRNIDINDENVEEIHIMP